MHVSLELRRLARPAANRPLASSSHVPGSGTGTAVTVGASRPSPLAPNRTKLAGDSVPPTRSSKSIAPLVSSE